MPLPINEAQIFWKNLEDIRDTLLMDEPSMAAFISISTKEYVNSRANITILSFSKIYDLCSRLGIDYNDLWKENFEVGDIINFESAKNLLPERYSVATYSRTTPILNILNYLQAERGIRAKADLIKKFHIPLNFFNSADQRTNIRLITDIVTYLKLNYRLKDQDFVSMGQRTPTTLKSNPLCKELQNKNTPKDVIEYFFRECTKNFDENFDYQIVKFKSDFAVIEATPQENVIEELKVPVNEFGNETACLTRMGVISSITSFRYEVCSNVTKISSIYRGDSSNKYLIDLSSLNS